MQEQLLPERRKRRVRLLLRNYFEKNSTKLIIIYSKEFTINNKILLWYFILSPLLFAHSTSINFLNSNLLNSFSSALHSTLFHIEILLYTKILQKSIRRESKYSCLRGLLSRSSEWHVLKGYNRDVFSVSIERVARSSLSFLYFLWLSLSFQKHFTPTWLSILALINQSTEIEKLQTNWATFSKLNCTLFLATRSRSRRSSWISSCI